MRTDQSEQTGLLRSAGVRETGAFRQRVNRGAAAVDVMRIFVFLFLSLNNVKILFLHCSYFISSVGEAAHSNRDHLLSRYIPVDLPVLRTLSDLLSCHLLCFIFYDFNHLCD